MQDTYFMFVHAWVMELLPLNQLEKSCPVNSSFTYSPIHLILGMIIHYHNRSKLSEEKEQGEFLFAALKRWRYESPKLV